MNNVFTQDRANTDQSGRVEEESSYKNVSRASKAVMPRGSKKALSPYSGDNHPSFIITPR